VYVSEDGCRSWQPRKQGLGNLCVNAIVVNPTDPDLVYAGTDGGAYISYDGGGHWGVVNDGLLGATVIYGMAIDPNDPDTIHAATPYGIFRLEDR